jgi:serine/threonine protein phosphatase 1
VEELIHIKNLIYIMGNHDAWLLDWLETGESPYIWTSQGGKATIASYIKAYNEHSTLVKERHLNFFSKAVFHHIDSQNRLFVHGGVAWNKDISQTSDYDKTWDRHMYITACMWHEQSATLKFKDYKEIFIGHTTTSSYDKTLNPVHVANLWNLDQGAGWEGKLTLMNVNTHHYWQSDIVSTLYPEERGRR